MKKIIIISISFLLLLSACKPTERGLNRKLDYVERHDKTLFAPRCERLYPVIEKVIKDSIYIQGKTDTITKILEVDCNDTANAGKVVQLPCKSYTRTDTSKVIERIEKENTAKLEALRQQYERELLIKNNIISELNYQLSKYKEKAAKYDKAVKRARTVGVILLSALALFLAFRFSIFGKIVNLINKIF